jgi:hypothetical protein
MKLTTLDYKTALNIQDAVNLPAILREFATVMPRILDECKRGTAEWNSHPIVVLYCSKLASLSNCEDQSVFSAAYTACKAKVPQWKHDCSQCIFLGQHEAAYKNADLYYCESPVSHTGERPSKPTFVARFSNEPSDNISSFELAKTNHFLNQAWKRAQVAGFVPHGVIIPMTFKEKYDQEQLVSKAAKGDPGEANEDNRLSRYS